MNCPCGNPVHSRDLCMACYMMSWRREHGYCSGKKSGRKPFSDVERVKDRHMRDFDMKHYRECYARAVGVKARLYWAGLIKEAM